uniref:Putative c2h2-type zn-finger protein n=1 Tax=Culex tarsalis TaxID=7177 RepID=A0A1Q3F0N6_CULTA
MASKCCRLCLHNGPDLKPILDHTIDSNDSIEPVTLALSELIVGYLSIEPLIESTIATFVCSECQNTIAKWHWFRESCLRNDGVYQKMAQDPEREEAAGEFDECFEIEIKQEPEVESNEDEFNENVFTEPLDALPKKKLAKKVRPKKVATKKTTPANEVGGEPPVKKKIGRPRLPEGERKPRTQMCTLCGKQVRRMTEHLRMHNQERCFQCPHCPFNFYNRTNWKNHVNVHTKEVKYTCPVCDKFFWRNETLKMHMNSHSEEPKYKCPYCPKAYRMRSGLVNHRKTHTQAPDIQCYGCDKKFFSKNRMQSHAVKHMAVKPFPCKICDRGFTRKYYLTGHMKKHHPNCTETEEMSEMTVGDSYSETTIDD